MSNFCAQLKPATSLWAANSSIRPTSRASVIKCQQQHYPQTQQSPRRTILFSALVGLGTVVLAPIQPALAFGSGFPGYDVNMDARKRAQDRIKREMQADLDRAAAYRAKLAAEKAAAAAAAPKPATPTSSK